MPPTLVLVHASHVHIKTFDGQLKEQEPDIPAKQVVISYFLYEARTQSIPEVGDEAAITTYRLG